MNPSGPNEARAADVAIIGMAVRFPGASNLDRFWENLCNGIDSIRAYSDAELRAAGVSEKLLAHPNYIKAGAPLADIDAFDAGFFGINPKDAAILDPQHRQFLECAWEGLEQAGYRADQFDGAIGVFAGCGQNSYLLHNLLTAEDLVEAEGLFALRNTGNDKDLLATRVSYQLNLRGPSINVQTACSSSLVAVHVACQNLLTWDCDMAIAGAVSIEIPHGNGYIYREGEVFSRDGKCRAFDAQSSGTVFGSGVGVVILRRLADAIAAGDTIYAVIKGSAVNNDGARKVGYLAPSVDGQIDVITQALAVAETDPASIDYIESHGTGTRIGDPIELAAIGQVFAGRSTPLLVGSVKTNIGHLDAASGIAGLIKTVMSVRSGRIPPTLHFAAPNPLIDFAKASIRVADRLTEWPETDHPRRAGVTSLGIGGTNAHVVLEEAPALEVTKSSRPYQVLTISARTAETLEAATRNLEQHLRRHPDLLPDDVAYTLHAGRREFPHRRVVLCSDLQQAVMSMDSLDPAFVVSAEAAKTNKRSVSFMFPGQGSQYVGMGSQIYAAEPVFRQCVDRCAELASERLGFDFRKILYPAPEHSDTARAAIAQTWNTQPILFAVEYALAQLWMSWGLRPKGMLGHSLGEYVAACLAGVFSLEDGIRLVCARGELMRHVEHGAMLAIGRSEADAASFLNPGLSLAAVNSPDHCVISGSSSAIDALERELTRRKISARRLQTSHAFHSHLMDPILDQFCQEVEATPLQAPKIPILSNVTGGWMTSAQATDPHYWVMQLRGTVRFRDALELLAERDRFLLEVGPGGTLSALAKQGKNGPAAPKVFGSLSRHSDINKDAASLYATLGRFWASGFETDWRNFHAHERRSRIPLPSYPFEKSRFWIGPRGGVDRQSVSSSTTEGWFYRPSWQKTVTPPAIPSRGPWLLFTGSHTVGDRIASDLRGQGAEVTTVRMGAAFERNGSSSFIINPSIPDDFKTLLDHLAKQELPRKVIWLLPFEEAVSASAALDISFYAGLSFVKHLMSRVPPARIDIGWISHGAVSVEGERVLHPEYATLAGICRVAPLEYPNLRCVHIDAEHTEPAVVAGAILAEMSEEPREATVAYRGGVRWVERIEPCHLEAVPSRLRTGGVYLITGGLGGLGLALADWLARSVQARLVLVSRDAEARAEHYRKALEKLEGAGSEFLICSADVTNVESMRQVIVRAQERFGAIHGVFHAAGILDDGIIHLKTPAAAARVLKPKVEGTRVLGDLLQPMGLDFLALFSSISSVIPPAGQADYCAANAYLNAFAQSRPATENVIAIGWSAWRDTGMAARTDGTERTFRAATHPLWERAESNTDTELAYSGGLSIERHWILKEHQFRGGDALLPGTASLDLALSLARLKLGKQAIALEDFIFLEPFRVSRGMTRKLRVQLRTEKDRIEFSMTGGGTTFTSGRIRPVVQEGRRIDLDRIVRRCAVSEDASPQNLRQEQYFEFGSHWRSLRHISFGTEECLALLELGADFYGELDSYAIHPALLDVAAGAALFLIPGYDRSGDLCLPFCYKRVTVYRPLPARIYSHARLRMPFPPELAVFDITIVDENGTVLIEIEEFAVKRLKDQQARIVQQTAASGPRAVQDERPASSAAERPRIATPDGIQALRQLLESQANPVIFVSPSDLRSSADARIVPVAVSRRTLVRDNTVGALQKMWQHVLGIDLVDPDADFFDVGGHSLAALRLFNEINEHFELQLGLSTIFEARTIRALASLIDGMRSDAERPRSAGSASLVPIRPNGSEFPLFFVHGVGGNVLNYQEVVQNLGADQPVYGFQSAGLGGSAPDKSVEQMAARYIPEMRLVQPEGPYFICGQSFGGLVAYEMGRQLEAQGQPVGFVGLIDTFQNGLPEEAALSRLWVKARSAGSRIGFHARRLMLGPDRITYLKATAKTGKRRISTLRYRRQSRRFERRGQDLPATLQDVRHANWLAARSYVPGIFNGTVVLFRCKIRSAADHTDYSMGWRHLVRGSLHIFEVPGDHLSMMTRPGAGILAQELTACMAELFAKSDAATNAENPSILEPSGGKL